MDVLKRLPNWDRVISIGLLVFVASVAAVLLFSAVRADVELKPFLDAGVLEPVGGPSTCCQDREVLLQGARKAMALIEDGEHEAAWRTLDRMLDYAGE